MSTEPNTNINCCKQRFKAVENFLRRIAFNLGNSPSQTEVKIISCIPIDVSDLQEKIIKLQNELESARKHVKKDTLKCGALVQPTCNAAFVNGNGDDESIRQECDHARNRLSTMSMSYYCEAPKKRTQKSSSCVYRSELSQEYPFYSEHNLDNISPDKNAPKNQGLRNFFSKKKKIKRKNKCNAQVVYYAQTHERTPFNTYSDFTSKRAPNEAEAPSINLNDLTDHFSQSFLANAFQKQYRPDPIFKVFSDSSNFSAPICRDVTTDVTTSTPPKCKCESEICSCCPGLFDNIYRNKRDIVTTPALNNRAKYYDSKHYDLVPVREKTAKIKKRLESPRRKKSNRTVMRHYSVGTRNKVVSPVTMNYQRQPRPLIYVQNYAKNLPGNVHSRRQKMVLNEMVSKRAACRPRQPTRATYASKVSCVDYGPVYAKQTEKLPLENTPINTSENEVPTPVATSNLKYPTDKSPPEENAYAPVNKTDATLNQIKAILQSVLTEVKTNSMVKKSAGPQKKDAVVQNGMSQNNMHGGSHLLQSFTYSPYSMNPFSPSCSRQIYPNNYAAYSGLPNAPAKCMQHYPILMQPQRHICTSCYRNSNIKTGPAADTKRAASAATNTEQIHSRSSETDKLIQEIYKSLALNLEIPKHIPVFSKQNTCNSAVILQKQANRENKQITSHVSELYRNQTELNSSVTRNTDTTIASKPACNEARVGSDTAIKTRVEPTKCQSSDDSATASDDNDNELAVNSTHAVESDEESDATVTAATRDVQQSSNDDSDSDAVVVELGTPVPILETKKKKGILNKMLQMLKPKFSKNKEPSISINDSESESSESDEYQTIYSHREAPQPAKHGLTLRRKPKVVYRKYQQRRSRSPEKAMRRQPYMEQEHRRQWNEELSFHEGNRRTCSHGMSRVEESRRGRAPIYAQNYETRTAFVQPMMTPNLATALTHNYVNYGARPATQYPMKHNTVCNRGANYFPGNYPTHEGICINYPGRNPSPEFAINCKPTPRFITQQVKRSHKGLSWLKKRGKNISVPCGEQWKKFILES